MKALHSTKLATLLSTFDSARMQRFGLYLRSPYFNTSNTIVGCYEALQVFHPAFDQEDCTLENLHSKVFAEKEYDYHRINNVMSDVYEQALNFLVQVSLDDQMVLERWHILPRLRQARLDKQFEQQIRKYEKLLEEQAKEDFTHIYWTYYYNEKIWYSIAHEPEKRFTYLDQQYLSLLNFVLIRLGRLATLLLYERYHSSMKFDLRFCDELVQFFEQQNVPDQPVVQLYRHALLLMRYHKNEDYFRLRELRDQHADFYTVSDLSFINIFLNHHVNWMNYERGQIELYAPLVEDTKRLLAKEFYRETGRMPFADFFNFVRIASIAKDFVWADELVERYLPLVIEEEQDNCRYFAAAVVARAQGRNREALTNIQQVNFRLPLMALQVKDLSIMLLFELEEYETCLLAVDAFRHYLKSLSSLPPRHVVAHQQFVLYTKRLISLATKVRTKERKAEIDKLKSEVADLEYNTLNIRSWLLEQLDQM